MDKPGFKLKTGAIYKLDGTIKIPGHGGYETLAEFLQNMTVMNDGKDRSITLTLSVDYVPPRKKKAGG